MKSISRITFAVAFAFASITPVFAQAPAPAVKPAPRIIPLTPAEPATKANSASAKPAAAKPVTAKTERTALSQKCSADADAKGLHGKARAKFRNDCKKGKS